MSPGLSASIHANGAAERAGYAGHMFETRKRVACQSVDQSEQVNTAADTRRGHRAAAVEVDLCEARMVQPEDDPIYTIVVHQQIGTTAKHADGGLVHAASTQQAGQGVDAVG